MLLHALPFLTLCLFAKLAAAAPPYPSASDYGDAPSVWFQRSSNAYRSTSVYECEPFLAAIVGTAHPLTLDVLHYPYSIEPFHQVVLHRIGVFDETPSESVVSWDTDGAEIGSEFVLRLTDAEGRATFSPWGMVLTPKDSFPSRECAWSLAGILLLLASIGCIALAVLALTRTETVQRWRRCRFRLVMVDETVGAAALLPTHIHELVPSSHEGYHSVDTLPDVERGARDDRVEENTEQAAFLRDEKALNNSG